MDSSDSGSSAALEQKNEDASVPKSQKKEKQPHSKKQKGGLKRRWALKAFIITFILSAFFSILSEMTESLGIVFTRILLLVFVAMGIIFDGVGVSVTSCELAPLVSMASRKVKGSKTAIKLVKNAEVVSNICNDVIGDCCSIMSGACTATLVLKIVESLPSAPEKILAVSVSALVSAMTVGVKACLKTVAINKSKEFVMLTSRILSVFQKEK